VKIVATIGPASSSPDRIDALLEAGMSVARVNCAHGNRDSLTAMIRALRARAERKQVPLAILADLGGPKLRIGHFQDGAVELRAGDRFTITTDDVVGTAERVSVNHHGLTADVQAGATIYLNDGLIRLVVLGVKGTEIETRVEVGGTLSDRKGLSVPSAAISVPPMTDKDWNDLATVADAKADYVGLSFVRSPSDIELLRHGLSERGLAIPIVAKIEKAQAVDNLAAVVDAADAVMVARGDLGVECPIEEVPVLQKRIIRTCNDAGKPVITATQMLESMVGSPRPTRAEATDVANAVLDGSDAVMLSAETATGRYPIETVRMMARIITTAEASTDRQRATHAMAGVELAIGDAIGRSACLAADSVRAQAIVCLTRSGATARHLAKWRPPEPILAVTPRPDTWHRLNLVWGVTPILVDDFGPHFDAACTLILETLRQRRAVASGRSVVLTAGLPFSQRGRTNTLRIESL